VKAGDIAEISVVVTNAGQERADGFTITVNLPNATLATFNLVDPDGATIAANALWTHTGNTLTRVILAPINPGEQQTFVFYITTAAGLPSGTKIDLPAETADYNLYPAPVPAVPATATSNISFITVGDIVVYPNPFNPKTAVNGACKFANLPKNTRITIFTLSGEMVQSFRNQTAIVTWNGTNMSKKPVSPGIYYYIITWNDGVNKMVGKIFLMRQ
jgi:hypothetical protein